MEPGVLYISVTYSTAGHLCPCGCQREVVTKLSPARWRIVFDGEVSLWPSIAATGLACNSHYFITRGDIDWRQKLSPTEIEQARKSDERALRGQRPNKGGIMSILSRRLRFWH